MNPSLSLLARQLRKTPQEVETAWRDAKQFRKTEGGKDYRLAWEHLGRLLKVTPPEDPGLSIKKGRKTFNFMILEQLVYVVEVGAETMRVETESGNTFLIPSYFLLVDSRTTSHDPVI